MLHNKLDNPDMTKSASTNQIELSWNLQTLLDFLQNCSYIYFPVRWCIHLLQSPVLGSSTPGDDLGDEDARVLPNMRIVCPSSNAEPKPCVPLKDMVKDSIKYCDKLEYELCLWLTLCDTPFPPLVTIMKSFKRFKKKLIRQT